MDWQQFLDGWHPRGDLYDDFPPRHLDDLQPALLNETGLLNAVAVAARVLEIVAQRGGTRLDSGHFTSLLSRVRDVLPTSAKNHCDEEAKRILQWLETADRVDEENLADSGLPPELDVMMASDIESRVSVARFAIDEDYALELEYFDEERQVWPRVYCTPVAIHGLEEAPSDNGGEQGKSEPSDDGEADDEDRALEDVELVVDQAGQTRHISVQSIRWLMPVNQRQTRSSTIDEEDAPEPADVLDFPGDTSS